VHTILSASWPSWVHHHHLDCITTILSASSPSWMHHDHLEYITSILMASLPYWVHHDHLWVHATFHLSHKHNQNEVAQCSSLFPSPPVLKYGHIFHAFSIVYVSSCKVTNMVHVTCSRQIVHVTWFTSNCSRHAVHVKSFTSHCSLSCKVWPWEVRCVRESECVTMTKYFIATILCSTSQ